MISPARKLAYNLLLRIEDRRLHSDDAVNSPKMALLDERDRRLATELIYGVLRRQAPLDWLLARVGSRPWKETDVGARVILRMSLYQLWLMDRIPDHALVNDAVELAGKELGNGIDKYVNGILRQLTRSRPWNEEAWLQKAPEWVQVSLPQWLWTRWRKRFGREHAREFALSLNQPPPVWFRVSEISRGKDGCDYFPSLDMESDIVPGAFLFKMPAGESREKVLKSPDIRFQDEASQLIPFLPGPLRPGCLVWDACAAPGGKSALIAEMLGSEGRLVSSDRNLRRAEHLRRFLKNSGAIHPSVIVADARHSPPFSESFDFVLADVPCSGLGTLRRNPEIKWRVCPDDFAALQETQQRILNNIADAVCPGGRLLYSTCSTEPEENERVVENFLKTRTDFRLEKPTHPAGIENWTGNDGMVRTFPGTRLWDGFFAALFVRIKH